MGPIGMPELIMIFIVLVAEHILLGIKVIIPMVIDDTPGWVHQEIAKQQVLEMHERQHVDDDHRIAEDAQAPEVTSPSHDRFYSCQIDRDIWLISVVGLFCR